MLGHGLPIQHPKTPAAHYKQMRIVPFITLTVATLSTSTVLAEQLRPTEELNGLVLGEVKDGGFDNWMAECYEPLDDGWSNSCISGVLPCNTGSGIIFGKSNYQFIDKPQTKDAGGYVGIRLCECSSTYSQMYSPSFLGITQAVYGIWIKLCTQKLRLAI